MKAVDRDEKIRLFKKNFTYTVTKNNNYCLVTKRNVKKCKKKINIFSITKKGLIEGNLNTEVKYKVNQYKHIIILKPTGGLYIKFNSSGKFKRFTLKDLSYIHTEDKRLYNDIKTIFFIGKKYNYLEKLLDNLKGKETVDLILRTRLVTNCESMQELKACLGHPNISDSYFIFILNTIGEKFTYLHPFSLLYNYTNTTSLVNLLAHKKIEEIPTYQLEDYLESLKPRTLALPSTPMALKQILDDFSNKKRDKILKK